MLDRTMITDKSASWILGLKTLQHLSIDAVVLEKLSEEEFSNLSLLQSISIHGKGISPALVAAMAEWRQLSMLRLDGATLEADMLKNLADCLSIRSFDFFKCDVAADGMTAFTEAHPSYFSMSLFGTPVPEALRTLVTTTGRLS